MNTNIFLHENPMKLQAATAADLMTPNVVSIRQDATIREAVALFTDRAISAAPVIDEAGRPVGVVSAADILVYDRERPRHVGHADFYTRFDLSRDIPATERVPDGFQIEEADQTQVKDIMTPTVFAVPLDATASRVVGDMLNLRVHRVFVADEHGVLVGVISTFDVLRKLRT